MSASLPLSQQQQQQQQQDWKAIEVFMRMNQKFTHHISFV
jgi:hypothetical protein